MVISAETVPSSNSPLKLKCSLHCNACDQCPSTLELSSRGQCRPHKLVTIKYVVEATDGTHYTILMDNCVNYGRQLSFQILRKLLNQTTLLPSAGRKLIIIEC